VTWRGPRIGATVREDGRVTQYGPQYQQPGYPAQGYPSHGYPAQPGYQPPQQHTAPNGLPLADFGVRLGARLIDGLIVGAISSIVTVPIILGLVFWSVGQTTVNDDGTVPQGDAAAFVVTILLSYAFVFVMALALTYVYEVELTKQSGQTPGKKMLKLRVVPVDPAQQVTRGVMARRWLVQGPGGMVPGLGLADGLWQLWDQPYRQCLHDKFARTVVVRVPG
jgi:uncharacterized RDD family membrane protein YckC